MEKFAILGGGGMAIELAELMFSEGKKVCGYYSPTQDVNLNSIIPYLGDEKNNFNPNFQYIVASGLINIRKKMIDFIESNNLTAGNFISSKAYVSPSANLGKGAVIYPFSAINAFTNIGNYLFLNFHITIGHNSVVGNNVAVNPGARITGNCKIGNNVSIGSNAALVPGTVIEDDAEIGILTYPTRKVKGGRLILSEPGRAIK